MYISLKSQKVHCSSQIPLHIPFKRQKSKETAQKQHAVSQVIDTYAEKHTEASHTHHKLPHSTAGNPAMNQIAGSNAHNKPLAAIQKPTPRHCNNNENVHTNGEELQFNNNKHFHVDTVEVHPKKPSTFQTYTSIR